LQVKCFGQSGQGQLGYEDSLTRGDSANEMGDYLPFLQFGSSGGVIALAVGDHSNCVMIETLQIKCWGDGTTGFFYHFILNRKYFVR